MQHDNKFTQWPRSKTPDTNIYWPAGQILPNFAHPADTLDAMFSDRPPMTGSEVLMLTSVQGVVNRTKPRLMLLNTKRGGADEWAGRLALNLNVRPKEALWDLVRKYEDEFKGFVLYDASTCRHYSNLASTAAGVLDAIAVSRAEMDSLRARGCGLQVIEDLTELSLETPAEIYQYMYDNYWSRCTRRVLVSLGPNVANDIRDMAVAVGAATLWLDPRIESEKEVLDKFLSDMEAGESIILGWWPEERSGIGIGTSHGISTIPSDFYDNATVYAGAGHTIFTAPVPKRRKLEDKVYICLFLSDGDNAQYCQHSMLRLWQDEKRGMVPINWTACPGLVDLGPGILNHYYATATSNDCICSGPSGLGYALIYDAHNSVWYAKGAESIEPYTSLSGRYLEKSGMRSITLWDDIDREQADVYERNCRYLYGMTRQDWQRRENLETMVSGGRLAVLPNRPCYVNNTDDILRHWKDTIRKFDGQRPVFLAAQGISWKMGPSELLALQEKLEELLPGRTELCRADHFFSYFNEANSLDFNILMSESATSGTDVLSDGSCAPGHIWECDSRDNHEIVFDLGQEYTIDRYVVRHAGFWGEDPRLNTKAFRLETSIDGMSWETADVRKRNRNDVTDIDFPAVHARYARLTIDNPGKDGTARIGDVEIYGKPIK